MEAPSCADAHGDPSPVRLADGGRTFQQIGVHHCRRHDPTGSDPGALRARGPGTSGWRALLGGPRSLPPDQAGGAATRVRLMGTGRRAMVAPAAGRRTTRRTGRYP